MSHEPVERRYGPTSGAFVGIVGLVFCALVVGLAAGAGPTPVTVRVGIAAFAAAVLVWAYLLRPRVILEADGATLRLRNPLSTWRIPLAEVQVVGVKTVTTVKTEDARYDAVAVGYPLRKLVRGNAPAGPGPSLFGMMMPSSVGTVLDPSSGARGLRSAGQDEQAVMVDTILAAADQARLHRRVGQPAKRTFAVIEIALVAAAAAAFLITYLV